MELILFLGIMLPSCEGPFQEHIKGKIPKEAQTHDILILTRVFYHRATTAAFYEPFLLACPLKVGLRRFIDQGFVTRL